MSVIKILAHRGLWYFKATKIYRNDFKHHLLSTSIVKDDLFKLISWKSGDVPIL